MREMEAAIAALPAKKEALRENGWPLPFSLSAGEPKPAKRAKREPARGQASVISSPSMSQV
uniref:Uncharacterized protein n=1 Tax=Oryza barthii TaxID=65489 RepID=A0A0D3FZB1_9ORYZ